MHEDSLPEREENVTPMMQQWHSCKKAAKDALLFFRMGDFYEAFYEDARILSQELDVTLTQRQGIPMSGVPWHTCETYLDRLVAKGYKVAIAEQVEDPKTTKGLVKREITRVVTPGTVINSSLIHEKTNHYIVALTQVGSIFGLASLDLSTGEFKVTEIEDQKELYNEMDRLKPAECVTSLRFKEKHDLFFQDLLKSYSLVLSNLDEWHFDHQTACNFLTKHFKVHHLDGFGLKGKVAAINAAGALLAYIEMELSLPITHIREIKPYASLDALSIDYMSQRNLELIDSLHSGGKKASLLHTLDKTKTPMGGRLLRRWISSPLLSVKEIHQRQDAIEALIFSPLNLSKLRQLLQDVRDLERLMMKIMVGYASPKDLVSLRFSLEQIAPLKEIARHIESSLIFQCSENLIDMAPLINLLKRALVDDPPLRISEGHVFKEGYHPELDHFRKLTSNGKEWIAAYQSQIREETGIKTLKVSFNKVFGYYIEVSKGQAKLMPETFIRRQTLVNSERFISPLLKDYESQVLQAEDKMQAIETELFNSLRNEVAEHAVVIGNIASAIALLDVLQGLAEVARHHHFVRPTVDESSCLEIVEGRHPVVETMIPKDQFIPNDTHLDGHYERLMLITGPNMAGKSTYIRQVALIVIMAQMGSFVPASKVHLGIVDKIFTRIGASDDLARGQSTFMVEMSETANILNNATSRSLVILDEIGRGTSTYDGVSIAWAVAEYLLTTEGKKAKILFATHYFELTQLEQLVPGAVNYHASAQEWNDDIVFLHKIVKGGADRSYGIHVARLAGLPFPVIARATEILKSLEQSGSKKEKLHDKKPFLKPKEEQLLLF